MNISNTKFDFDDILIMPSKSTEITSRYEDVILPKTLPLFTAPMDTVVNLDNMEVFIDNKINVTLPRTIKYKEYLTNNSDYYYNHDVFESVFISLGFNDIDFHLKFENFRNFQPNTHILIDVANGHMEKIANYAKDIKKHRPDIKIMVGNIANPETYTWYAEQDCVDYIRVGIGNGGGCLTTKQSGVGHPMASLIHEVYLEKQKFIGQNVPAIVADGGMKDYSDIIKALALGADYVMIGSIFNKALESCADNYLYGIKVNKKLAEYLFDKGYPIKKYFRGMSTKGAQKAMGKDSFKTSEGVVRYRKVGYRLDGWVENFEHYLRNAMSYANAKTLDEFIGKVEICQISKSAYDRFNK
jgi:IMP dehydrogenase/GMP reductase